MDQPLNGVPVTGLSAATNDQQPVSSGKAQTDFSDMLKDAINSVNTTQTVSDQKTEVLASREINQLH